MSPASKVDSTAEPPGMPVKMGLWLRAESPALTVASGTQQVFSACLLMGCDSDPPSLHAPPPILPHQHLSSDEPSHFLTTFRTW